MRTKGGTGKVSGKDTSTVGGRRTWGKFKKLSEQAKGEKEQEKNN